MVTQQIMPLANENFIGVYILSRTLHVHDHLQIRKYFSSPVEKYFTCSLRSLKKYFSTLEQKFSISTRPCLPTADYIYVMG